jgi:hypothetical protein
MGPGRLLKPAAVLFSAIYIAAKTKGLGVDAPVKKKREQPAEDPYFRVAAQTLFAAESTKSKKWIDAAIESVRQLEMKYGQTAEVLALKKRLSILQGMVP